MRAADRAAGVVDQEVDAAVLLRAPCDERVAVARGRRCRQVGDARVPPMRLDLASSPRASFSSPRATIITCAPASASLSAAALPMPDEPPVTSTTLPRTLPASVRSMNRSGSRWRSQ